MTAAAALTLDDGVERYLAAHVAAHGFRMTVALDTAESFLMAIACRRGLARVVHTGFDHRNNPTHRRLVIFV